MKIIAKEEVVVKTEKPRDVATTTTEERQIEEKTSKTEEAAIATEEDGPTPTTLGIQVRSIIENETGTKTRTEEALTMVDHLPTTRRMGRKEEDLDPEVEGQTRAFLGF
jgi:hypothetical protein